MTTRAGFAGLLTGLILTIMIYPFFVAWPDAFLQVSPEGSPALCVWITGAFVAIMMIGGGFLAGRWSRSSHHRRCAALGGLAGGLAGTIVFCLWGAAAAGTASWVPPLDHPANEAVPQIEIIGAIIRQTMLTFLPLFLGGSGLGALGGWLACHRQPKKPEAFDMDAPQMAMNASITAVPASIIAAVLSAAVFSRLSNFIGMQTGQSVLDRAIVELPLQVSLLLVLISHFALTMVVPHETRQAQHLCGLNEVKMAAYVGIGAAPLLILLLFLVDANSFSNPVVVSALLLCTGMSLKSLHTLLKLVLPRRASFSSPQDGRQKKEAKWFGSIAKSHGPRLIMLCIGCGLMMVLPFYLPVFSVLINLTSAQANPAFSQSVHQVTWGLFLNQALASIGLATITIAALSAMYLFYLNLGRWFSKRNSQD